MEMRINKNFTHEMKFLNSFLMLLMIAGIFTTFILGIMAKEVMTIITNFKNEEIENNLQIYILFLYTTLLFSINSFFAEIFVSHKHFTIPILLNLSLNICIILSVFLFHNQLGGVSMMSGALFLVFIAFISFIYYMKKKLNWRFSIWDFNLLKTSLRPIIGLVINQCIVIFVSTYPYYLLSKLPIGSISVVNYAMKFVLTPYAIMQQIAIVLQVRMNELHAQKKQQELYSTTKKIAQIIFVIGLIIAFSIYAMRNSIIYILYGFVNMPSDTMRQLTSIISIAIFALPFIGFGQVWVKLYFAQRRIKMYICIMVSTNIISCGIYYSFVSYCQISGYAIAYALTESLIAIALWYNIRKKKYYLYY